MTEELSTLISGHEADDPAPDLPGASIGRPCDVSRLQLPLDSALFANEEFRKGFCSSHLLGFLPSQLRALRKSEGLSQKDLAKKLNTQQSAVSRLEKVDNGSLNIGTAIEIGEALDRPFIAYWGYYSELLGHVARSEQHPQAFLATASYRDDPGFHPSKPPVPSAEDDQVRAVQKALFQWLDTPSPDCGKLMRFLRGRDLPPISDTLPPFEWLLLAIREWGLAGKARENFFSTIARCLRELATAFRKGTEIDWDQWIPLFHLSAHLSDPPRLADPLYELFELFVNADGRFPLDVRVALRGALLKNPDARLLPRLKALQDGSPSDPFLAGTREEIEQARKTAGYRAVQHPAGFVKTTALLIQHDQADYVKKETFQKKTLASLRKHLLAGGDVDDIAVHGAALIFRGARYDKWQTRTARWTLEILQKDLQAPVRRVIEQCWPEDSFERRFLTENILEPSPVDPS
jgi:transcriptional regulator with XRE-family HTH domain